MSTQRLWALVPIKDSSLAKGRLAPYFNPQLRRDIFAAMIEDVLAALAASTRLRGFSIVTTDPIASELTLKYGGQVIEYAADHNDAVSHAIRQIVATEAIDAVLTLPMDVPLITPADINEIVAAHNREAAAVTIVPSHDLRGTNALLSSPPACISSLFGQNSFTAHCAAARRAQLRYSVLRLPNVELDIDHPQDIDKLLRISRDTHTHALLARSGYPAVARADSTLTEPV